MSPQRTSLDKPTVCAVTCQCRGSNAHVFKGLLWSGVPHVGVPSTDQQVTAVYYTYTDQANVSLWLALNIGILTPHFPLNPSLPYAAQIDTFTQWEMKKLRAISHHHYRVRWKHIGNFLYDIWLFLQKVPPWLTISEVS